MADYRSTLTGTQMDSALLDMAEHNSEAYAVGERNGIAVASDDVTYHNNARYYAQIASSQIVGDASSAVRWDTDQSEALTDAQKAVARNNINAASDSDVVKITSQTLTTAQQAQARANIAAGGSNRNLLDNPFFTINQREATSGGSGTYPADRWGVSYGTGGVNWSRNSDGSIAVTPNNLASHGDLTQKIATEVFPFLADRTVTVSVMLADGTIYSGSIVVSTSGTRTPIYVPIDDKILQVNIYAGGTFSIQSWKGTLSIKAAKLEFGSISTLANDVPPNYAEELAKCQPYFLRLKSSSQALPLGFGVQSSSTAVRLLIPTPVEMRAQPTVSFSGTHRIFGGDATSKTVSSYSVVDRTSSGIGLVANISSGTFAENKVYILYVASGGYLDLSADNIY